MEKQKNRMFERRKQMEKQKNRMLEMTAEPTTMVSIPIERFRELILIEDRCMLLMRAVYQDVGLSYNKSKLSLDTSALEAYLRLMDTERYLKIHEQLLKGEDHEGTNQN